LAWASSTVAVLPILAASRSWTSRSKGNATLQSRQAAKQPHSNAPTFRVRRPALATRLFLHDVRRLSASYVGLACLLFPSNRGSGRSRARPPSREDSVVLPQSPACGGRPRNPCGAERVGRASGEGQGVSRATVRVSTKVCIVQPRDREHDRRRLAAAASISAASGPQAVTPPRRASDVGRGREDATLVRYRTFEKALRL
jgi:hypothetical protein